MENQIIDDKIDLAINNILTAYLAQVDSALKISSILAEHSEDNILNGDCIIGGLVYRLMVPMTDDEMVESYKNASDIMNIPENESENESETESENEHNDELDEINNGDNVLNDLKVIEPRKININNCNCNICKKVKDCIENYHTYKPIDELAFKFKNSITETCIKHNILI
tara:strand:- start:584 stop:1093 length:510 start_codon:yes stop_codon:yes gene_type:complete